MYCTTWLLTEQKTSCVSLLQTDCCWMHPFVWVMCHVLHMMHSQFMRLMKYIFARHSPFCNNFQYLKWYSNKRARHPDEFVEFEIICILHMRMIKSMLIHILLSLISGETTVLSTSRSWVKIPENTPTENVYLECTVSLFQ